MSRCRLSLAELAANGGRGERFLGVSGLEVLTLGDDVRAGDGAQPGQISQTDEGHEVSDVDPVSTAGLGLVMLASHSSSAGISAPN